LINFFQENFKTEQQDQNASNEQLTTHTFSGEGRGKTLSLSQKYDLLSQNYDLVEHKQKVYSESSRKCTRIGAAKAYSVSSKSCTRIGAQGLIRLRSVIYSNKVYITMSSVVSQAQTRIQEQRVLRSNQMCDALRFKHNVYSDLNWSTRVCNQTRIQAPSVLGLDQIGIQIKASNCD
jgi:hypothetical protein